MLDLNDFRLFVEVIDRGSLSAAGRSLALPTSTISYRLKQLERALGLLLVMRTSRRISLTDAGAEFYRSALVMLEKAREAEIAMRNRLTEPAGAVRFSVAIAIAQFAMPPLITEFLARHPKVDLVQFASDRYVDIVAERLDFAIRGHPAALPDSALIQRPLADVPWHLFASADHVREYGEPTTPADLSDRPSLFVRRDHVTASWRLSREDDPEKIETVVSLKPRLLAACMSTLKIAARAGFGIVALPAYICRDEVRAGSLRRVLPGWVAARSTISVFMPNRRGLSAASRALLEHLVARFPEAVRYE